MLKKIKWVNFKDLIGFIQWFMNWAAPGLVDRKELRGAIQNKRLIERESRDQKVILGKKQKQKWIGYGVVFQAHYLTSADQVILTDGLNIPFLGELKLIKSQFDDVGLSISDSVWD